jgi:hypothetical protein
MLEINSANIDSADYRWIVDYVNDNCFNSIEIENFSFSDSAIEFVDPCAFPHAIRSQEPVYRLIYS